MKDRPAARLPAPGLLLALVMAACGGGESVEVAASGTPAGTAGTSVATTTTPATAPAPTTAATAPPTTSAAPPTPAPAPPGEGFTVREHGLHPDPLQDSGGWLGSGCTPRSETLPDGVWWGYAVSLSGSEIVFDLACVRWEDDPNDDYLEEGGWVFQNENPVLRTVPVHPEALVACLMWRCPPDPYPYTEWIEDDRLPHGEPDTSGLWLYVNRGVVTEIGQAGFAG